MCMYVCIHKQSIKKNVSTLCGKTSFFVGGEWSVVVSTHTACKQHLLSGIFLYPVRVSSLGEGEGCVLSGFHPWGRGKGVSCQGFILGGGGRVCPVRVSSLGEGEGCVLSGFHPWGRGKGVSCQGFILGGGGRVCPVRVSSLGEGEGCVLSGFHPWGRGKGVELSLQSALLPPPPPPPPPNNWSSLHATNSKGVSTR